MKETKVYFPNLNGLRFIAALSVIVYHFYGIETLNGHLGVILFFVLSGFLITYLLFTEKTKTQKIDYKKFYIRRVLRIWPLYFLIVLIGVLAELFQGELGDMGDYKAILMLCFFVPNVSFVLGIGIQFTQILWSVGSEEQFYIVWPWLVDKTSKIQLLLSFFLLIFIFSFVPHLIDYVNNRWFGNEINLLYYTSRVMLRMGFNSMATGGILAYLLFHKSSLLKILYNPILQVINVVLLIYCWVNDIHFFLNDQTYALMFGLLIIYLAGAPNKLNLLENSAFNYLGKISFGLYVYHTIVFFMIKQFKLSFEITFPFRFLEFVVSICITIIISSLSYYLFELRFLKIKEKSFSVIKSG